jgi:hypothetical protein
MLGDYNQKERDKSQKTRISEIPYGVGIIYKFENQ